MALEHFDISASQIDFPPDLRNDDDDDENEFDIFYDDLLQDLPAGANLQNTLSLSEYDDPDSPESICRSLNEIFFQSLRQLQADSDILTCVASFRDNCTKYAIMLSSFIKQGVSNKGRSCFSSSIAILEQLLLECATWDVLHELILLYKDENGTSSQHDSSKVNVMMWEKSSNIPDEILWSDLKFIDHFYKSNQKLQKEQMLVDWLQRSYMLQRRCSLQNTSKIPSSIYWENSRFEMESKIIKEKLIKPSSDHGKITPNDIMSEMFMDPDCYERSGSCLSATDSAVDEILLEEAFKLIRSGLSEEACKLFNSNGHYWRSICMQGWKLYNNPVSYNEPDGVPCSEGNRMRDSWLYVCKSMIANGCKNPHEAAIFSLYCGNLEKLLNVAETWEDHLWSHLSCSIQDKVNKVLRSVKHTAPCLSNRVEFRSPLLSIDDIIYKLSNESPVEIRNASKNFHRRIQCMLIQESSELESSMKELLKDLSKYSNSHALRFMANFMIVLSFGGFFSKNLQSSDLIRQYIMSIASKKYSHVAPFYVSFLSSRTMQSKIYAEFLLVLPQDHIKRGFIDLAINEFLDVESICIHIARICLQKYLNSSAKSDPEICQEFLIDPLDWLLTSEEHRVLAVSLVNLSLCHTILNGQFDFSQKIMSSLPSDSLTILSNFDFESEDLRLLISPETVSTIIMEHLKITKFLDAHKAYISWSNHLVNQPQAVEGKNISNRMKETISSWEQDASVLTTSAVQSCMDVLTFPGGWMNHVNADVAQSEKPTPSIASDSPQDFTQKSEVNQMDLLLPEEHKASLRKFCIPRVLFLLLKVLQFKNDHQAIMEISCLISDQTKRLYECFERSQLEEILKILAESTLSMVEGLTPSTSISKKSINDPTFKLPSSFFLSNT